MRNADRDASALVSRASSLAASGDHAGALLLVEQALAGFPDDPALNAFAGEVTLKLGDAESALDYFGLALHYSPSCFEAFVGRIRGLAALKRDEQIEPAYRSFLEANPHHAEAAYGLAVIMYQRSEYDEAAWLLQKVLERGDHIVSLNLLGLIEARIYGRLEEGKRKLRRSLELDPAYVEARINLAWVLAEQRRYDEAQAYLDEALERDAADHEARLMRGYIALKRGDFEHGWGDFEARHASALAIASPFHFPRWSGAPFPDRTLLVYAEQGLGDQIMFCSCLPEVLKLGGRIVVECESRLVPLVQRSFPRVIVKGAEMQPRGARWLEEMLPIDAQIPMGSLPGLFRRSWQDFPQHDGYLIADPDRVRVWEERLAAISGRPKVGISWRGGTAVTRRLLRSIRLEQLGSILAQPALFVSLQYGDVGGEIEAARAAGMRLEAFPDVIADIDETAALISALDLVISVCTAAVHLGGALGKPVWVLAPSVPEWRYLEAGIRMPWYPSVRLFRQDSDEPWDVVIGRVATELKRYRGDL